jgi:hypothetical protein
MRLKIAIEKAAPPNLESRQSLGSGQLLAAIADQIETGRQNSMISSALLLCLKGL